MLSRWFRSALPTALALGALTLAGCAAQKSPPPVSQLEEDADEDTNDPLENINRPIFQANITLDKYVAKPIAQGYREVTPDVVRTGIRNVLNNLKTPVILVNDALQGNAERAGQTFARFWLNTVLGLGGLIDVGTSIKIPGHDADFGQTFGAWGIGTGPYLMLPLLGPSNPRDALGSGVEMVADPYSLKFRAARITAANPARTGGSFLTERTDNLDTLDDLERNSLDYYAALRSLYQQKRAGDVKDAIEGKLVKPPAPKPAKTSALPTTPSDQADAKVASESTEKAF